MPRLVTMGKLEARCQRRADLEEDDHISHEEWLEIINESWGELFGIVAGAGLRYFETRETFTTDGSNELAEPVNVRSIVGLWLVESSGHKRLLRPLLPQERAQWSGSGTDSARRYEFIDNTLYLYPTPPTGQTYELLYIPEAPDVSEYASDDCVDCVTAEGEAFVIWGAVVKAKSKSESDVRLALAERERLGSVVKDWALNRMMIEPQRRIVTDIDLETSERDW